MAWKSWHDAVVKKSQVLTGKTGSGAPSIARPDGARCRKRGAAAVARLRVRLPGLDGKVVPGLGEVQIVGSREWENLQGRVAVV